MAGDEDRETEARPYQPPAGRDPSDVPCLEVLAGSQKGRTLPLIRGRNEIGRAGSSLLTLTDDGVSRHHATVEVDANGSLSLIDRGSTNGTYVNGTRIDRIVLREGDRVQIGPDVTVRIGYRSRAELAGARPRIPETAPEPAPVDNPLTDRELEVARLAAEDLTNAEIGARLHISPKTVKTHLRNIYERLDVHSRVALSRWLMRAGLLDRPE